MKPLRAALAPFIALSLTLPACVTSEPGAGPSADDAPAFDLSKCQGFRNFDLAEIRERMSDEDWQKASDRVTNILADQHIPEVAKDAETLILAYQASYPTVRTTIWYSAERQEWRGYRTSSGTAYGPVPPPPPPPPPPEDPDQLEKYKAARAKEQARKEAAERAEEELRREGYVYTAASTAIIEAWMNDPCFAAEPDFIRTPLTLKLGDRAGEGWYCPPDGNFWVGEIRKRGETVRQMSVPCISKTATHGFLAWATSY
ncbi:hypothetical protein [Henriciella mobilis]|uniref:Uncharacterized protein n=1 Tax=Henriciella mobilis TaxID=2305467 RepID=A0A399RK36_9PROT|nr:hypothetical protein [Henriciella mobilis]RIJ30109.1 hypothetical protein D1223_05495 [Henriciella mobilis]